MKKIFTIKNFNKTMEAILFILMLIISFALCAIQFFDHDEFEAIHTVWKIIKGQVIYIDFFQQKPPFFHITMIPLLKIFNESINAIMACKIYCYFLYLGIVFATLFISEQVFGSKTKFLTPIILISCTYFTDKLTEVRPDTLYIMLIMISLAYIYKDIKIKKTSLVLSGIFAGLSFAVLPKAAFYIVLIFAILCFRLLIKKISFKDLCIYCGSIIITIVPFIIYYISKSISFEQFWFFNFTMNYKFLGAFSPINGYIKVFLENPLLYITGIVGLFFLRGYRQKEISFLAIVLYLSVFMVNVPNKQYFVPAMPFIAMLGANLISKIKFTKNITALVAILIIIHPVKYFYKQIKYYKNHKQLAKIEFVLNLTDPNDKVYDGSIYFNVFRDDVDYFWFSVRPNGVVDTYKQFKPSNYDIYKNIKEQKPKIIYAKYLDENHELIRKYYAPTMYKKMYIRRYWNE